MIYYVRHGQTIWNRQLRLQGHDDSPLTLWGVELAVTYGEWLRDAVSGRRVRVVSSPLGRARQTAAVIADLIELPEDALEIEPLVIERDVGAWSGMTWREIERSEGEARDALRAWHRRPPGGESASDVFERAKRYLAKPRPAEVTIIVSHGGFSRTLRGAFLSLDPDATRALSSHDHGRLYRLAGSQVEEIVTDSSPRPPEAALG